MSAMKAYSELRERRAVPLDLERHPCITGEAHTRFGRIHLPVSPSCNIQCRYCKRGFNKWEASPGVADRLLTPEKAAAVVARAIRVCPEITVVGVAGPGEPLAGPEALRALRLVHGRFPDLIMCLSTNGLNLPQFAEEVRDAGVRSLTVTVNAVDPAIQKDLCSHIRVDDLFITGEEGARRLIGAQLAGIRKVTDLGVFVKINTVLVPGINNGHIGEVARAAAASGASMMNVIPLLPRFEFSSLRPPSSEEVEEARREAEEILPQFTNCRRCRADACGIPGSGVDYGRALYGRVEPTFSHG